MGWIFGRGKKSVKKKKTSKKKKEEVQTLERTEEELIKKEIQLVEIATRDFINAVGGTYYGSTASHKHGVVTVPDKKNIPRIIDGLSKVETLILNVRTLGKKVEKLSKQLEADLLDIRETTQDKRLDHLSEDELRVLDYTQNINKNIQALVELIRNVKKHDFLEIIHEGGYELRPKNKKLGEQIKQEFDQIHQGLSTLHKHLVEVFELEKTVEELTAVYIGV